MIDSIKIWPIVEISRLWGTDTHPQDVKIYDVCVSRSLHKYTHDGVLPVGVDGEDLCSRILETVHSST